MRTFNIDKIAVGEGALPLFLPDIGMFFDPNSNLAERMVRQLTEAGVDIIKGENLHRPDICLIKSATIMAISICFNFSISSCYRMLSRGTLDASRSKRCG